MSSIELQAQTAEDEIGLYEVVRDTWANLLRDEMKLTAERAVIKDRIVVGLIGATNPLTGRPHSASSAEAAADVDEEYRAHLLNLRNTVHAKNRAETQATAAQLRAHLALALVKVQAGVL